MALIHSSRIEKRQKQMFDEAIVKAFNFLMTRNWDGERSVVSEFEIITLLQAELQCESGYIFQNGLVTEKRILEACNFGTNEWRYRYFNGATSSTSTWTFTKATDIIEELDTNSFLYLAATGQVPISTLPTFIEKWQLHYNSLNPNVSAIVEMPLSKFLGMNHSDYLLYLEDPDNITFIVNNCNKNLSVG